MPVVGEGVPYFSSMPWLECWRAHYARPSDQFLQQPCRLNGIDWLAPLMVRRHRFRGLPAKVLRFAGTGDLENEEVATEFPDIYTAGDAQVSDGVLPILLDSLSGEWDLFRADCISPDSVIAQECERLGAWRLDAGWRYRVSLRGSFESWLTSLKSSVRQRFRRILRRAADAELSMRWVTDDDSEAGLDVLAGLHQQRWQSKGRSGAFSSSRFTAFHRDLLKHPHSGARIALVEQAGEPVAAWYGFDVQGERYYYQSGIASGLDRLSLGIVMHLMVIEDAFASGLHGYDLMRGKADSYKRQFCPKPTPLYHYQMPAQSWRGRLLALGLARSTWQPVSARGRG